MIFFEVITVAGAHSYFQLVSRGGGGAGKVTSKLCFSLTRLQNRQALRLKQEMNSQRDTTKGETQDGRWEGKGREESVYVCMRLLLNQKCGFIQGTESRVRQVILIALHDLVFEV